MNFFDKKRKPRHEVNLKNIKGEKIREQYFNLLICLLIFAFFNIATVLTIVTLTDGEGTKFTSVADFSSPFYIHIGGMAISIAYNLVLSKPTLVFIDDRDLFLIRDIALSGIKIHSDVLFTKIETGPLPNGIVVDQNRRMLIGSYSDYKSGVYNVHICISNSFGSVCDTFSFILSCILSFHVLL